MNATPNYANVGTDARPEKSYTQAGIDAPPPKLYVQAGTDVLPAKVYANGELHRLPSLDTPQADRPSELMQDDIGPQDSSGDVSLNGAPSHGQWTTLLPPQGCKCRLFGLVACTKNEYMPLSVPSPLPIPRFHNEDSAAHFAPEPLKPAIWQDDMSELSSRDTTPGKYCLARPFP